VRSRKVALIIGGNSGIGLLFARPTAHLLLVSGISDVALAVSVGKHAPEIQYLRTSISEEQRREFGRLLEPDRVGSFDSHSGIRFQQNGCVSCSHLGLCLNNEPLVAANLIRNAGASDLDWLDELVD
jgi:NAD(P)-dependent dehydrogenase (short-subunit alcohol dehydrogenase family)